MVHHSSRIVAPVTDADDHEWWRHAVVYQIYPRSFADGDGDGVGDIAGIRSRLDYLARLGVDAVWISPWYPSPMKDAGYDVADYRDIDPVFGTLDAAERLIHEAHSLNLRVLLDIVPNHTSDQHPWFQEALRAVPNSPERERFYFRDGVGPNGQEPPNNWVSNFGGSAWSRTTDGNGPGQWYLHLYAREQPDLNWNNLEVRADFERTLRFWFDRGVDGFRIDVAHGLTKAEGLPDVDLGAAESSADHDHPHWDRDDAHEIYRAWRAIGDSYAPPRVFVAEAWVKSSTRLARYVRRDILHTAFNFDYLMAPWRAPNLRETIDRTLAAHDSVGAPPTWVLSNHDVVRDVSRFAREQPDHPIPRLQAKDSSFVDLVKGTRRARASALLMLALPGGAYIYQGQELGLPEVEDLPDDVRQDPIVHQSGGHFPGRDGCRVPIPWAGEEPPYEFSPSDADASPWLPQPPSWANLSVAAQAERPDSTLEMYRAALRLRRTKIPKRSSGFRWLAAPEGALMFARDPGFVCLVNISSQPLELPADSQVLLRSGDLTKEGRVPHDTTVWLNQPADADDERPAAGRREHKTSDAANSHRPKS